MKCHYLAVSGFRSEAELRAYLYSHSSPYNMGTNLNGVMWAIVEVMSSDPSIAQYQADRLSSGMMGVTVHTEPYWAAVQLLNRL